MSVAGLTFPVEMIVLIMIGLVDLLILESLVQLNSFCRQALASINCNLVTSRHAS